MKLLYCIGTISDGGGTAKVLALKTSYFVDKLGYDVHILVAGGKNKSISYDFSSKVKIHFIEDELNMYNLKSVPIISFFSYMIHARKIYKKIVENINPDFVTVLGPFAEDLFIPKICRNLKIKSVREFHFAKNAIPSLKLSQKSFCDNIKHDVMFYITNRQFEKYDHIVLLTKRDFDESKYNTSVHIIPNASEIGVFDKYPNYESKKVISVGSMRSNVKQFDIQIKLWKIFIQKRPGWTLHIYGDGKIRNDLERLIKQSNLESSVFLHGHDKNISQRLLEASFYLSTSVAEGLPMTFLEALEAGLPIISYDCPCGPSDLVSDGENGFLVPLNNEKIILDKMLALSCDKNLILMMGKNSKIKSRDYCLESICDKWSDFYEQNI